MAAKKSSRIIPMNYRYILKKMNYPSESFTSSLVPIDEVFEYFGNDFIEVWAIEVLQYQKIEATTKETKQSFTRTKNWIIQNYPELML